MSACGLAQDNPSTATASAGEQPLAEADAALSEELARAREETAEAARRLAEREELLRDREEQLARMQELQEREQQVAERERQLIERESRALAEERRLARERTELQEIEDHIDDERAELAARGVRLAQDLEETRAEESRIRDLRRSEEEEWRQRRSFSRTEERIGAADRLRAGMAFLIEIQESLSSGTSQEGDTFRSIVVEDIYDSDGVLVVPAGSKVLGVVVEAKPLRRVGGQAVLGLEFDRLVFESGETIEIRASLLEVGKNKKKDKAKIAGAAVAGAILGRILGDGEAAAVGAAVGAAAGTAAVMRAEGHDVEVPAGTVVKLELEEVVTVTTKYGEIVRP